MKILVTNDDGIQAQGIYFLAKELAKFAQVFVVAPDRQRSATGHGITLHYPLRAEEVNFFDTDIKAWSIDGTPTDCVKLAMECLLKEKIDLVVSGINKGPNLGTDVIYSGTVSAAIEGSIFGIQSIAISLATFDNPDYKFSAKFAADICKKIYGKPYDKNVVMNINIPPVEESEVRGVKVCHLGIRKYKNSFQVRQDPRGGNYYWMAGEIVDEPGLPGSDVEYITENYITLSPIHFDLTKYEMIRKLQSFEEWK